MLPIQDSRVNAHEGRWLAACQCGKVSLFAQKASALTMLTRGTCRYCKRDYRNVVGNTSVYKNKDNKWCSRCSSCGDEQAYTRKDHAKQSKAS